MKRLIVLIGVIFFFAINIFAQGETDGVKGTGWRSRRYKENIKDSTFFQIAPTYASGQYIDLATVFVKLRPDTVHVTTETYTVLATDASKVHVFYNDFTLVTIAAYATQPIPVGTWTTFVSKGGKVRFTGTNVHSELDSLTINLKGAAQLFKIGQNDNLIFGGLLN